MPKKIPVPTNTCSYRCENGLFVLLGGNAQPGYYCPSDAGSCSTEGEEISLPAVEIPPDASRRLAPNQGQYIYHVASKNLLFSEGKSGPGRFFPNEISIKELAKFDEKSAELVKSMVKNKSVASFSIILKAQKI